MKLQGFPGTERTSTAGQMTKMKNLFTPFNSSVMNCKQEVLTNIWMLGARVLLVILGITGYISNLLGRKKQPLAHRLQAQGPDGISGPPTPQPVGSGLLTGINCAWKHLSASARCDNRCSNEAASLCASPPTGSQACWRSNSDDMCQSPAPSPKSLCRETDPAASLRQMLLGRGQGRKYQ